MPIRRFSNRTRKLLSNLYFFFDDFVGTSYDPRFWSVRGSGGTITILTGGIVELHSNNNKWYELYGGDMGDFSVAKYAKCTWRFYVPDPTSMKGYVGFKSSVNPTTQWLAFLRDSSTSANWLCEVTNGTLTQVNTGVAVDSNYHEGTVECAPGSIKFYLDGLLVATITTNIPTDALQLYAYVTGSSGGAKNLNVDVVEATGNRE